MANSQPISELSAYGAGTSAGAQFKDDDLLIVSSKKTGNDYKSYSITFAELYSVIKNKLKAELGAEWANLPIVTSLTGAKALAHDDIAHCLGPGVAQDLEAKIVELVNAKKIVWQS